MPIGYLFWALFLIYIIFGGVWWRNGSGWSYGWGGGMLLVMILMFLLVPKAAATGRAHM